MRKSKPSRTQERFEAIVIHKLKGKANLKDIWDADSAELDPQRAKKLQAHAQAAD